MKRFLDLPNCEKPKYCGNTWDHCDCVGCVNYSKKSAFLIKEKYFQISGRHFTAPKTDWNSANEACRERGGQLAILDDVSYMYIASADHGVEKNGLCGTFIFYAIVIS